MKPKAANSSTEKQIQDAIFIAVRFGSIDGAHHKTWVIDQMVRVLAGDRYADLIADIKGGENGRGPQEWDCGTAPST